MNEEIVKSLNAHLAGDYRVPSKSGMCLAFARTVIERARYGGRWALYKEFLVAETSRRTGADVGRGVSHQDPWASDFEASMKALGLAVPFAERQPGDLIFNHNAAAPVGHIGILANRHLVAENINHAYRPKSILLDRHLALTKLENFPRTLIARIPDPTSPAEPEA